MATNVQVVFDCADPDRLARLEPIDRVEPYLPQIRHRRAGLLEVDVLQVQLTRERSTHSAGYCEHFYARFNLGASEASVGSVEETLGCIEQVLRRIIPQLDLAPYKRAWPLYRKSA